MSIYHVTHRARIAKKHCARFARAVRIFQKQLRGRVPVTFGGLAQPAIMVFRSAHAADVAVRTIQEA